MDDEAPTVQPESLVPVERFSGSRLASAPAPSPFQSNGGGRSAPPPQKVRRLSSGSSIGAAIVDVENSLEPDVCIPLSLKFYVTLLSERLFNFCVVKSGKREQRRVEDKAQGGDP